MKESMHEYKNVEEVCHDIGVNHLVLLLSNQLALKHVKGVLVVGKAEQEILDDFFNTCFF